MSETGEVRVGTRVAGECGCGPVVAMSVQWCIYRDGPMEYAEPWDQITILARPVAGPASAIETKGGVPFEGDER
jgi:hypothetical protein